MCTCPAATVAGALPLGARVAHVRWMPCACACAARLFLLCTFVEDALRMLFQWEVQATHVSTEWHAEDYVGNTFVAFNLVCQAIPCTILLLNGIVTMPRGLIQFCIALLVVVVMAQVSHTPRPC